MAGSSDIVASLQPGADHQFRVSLVGGKAYSVHGVCDSDCNDVDLELLQASDGLVVGSDLLTDDYPVVDFNPSADGDYYVRLILKTCVRAPCFVAVRVLVNSTPIEPFEPSPMPDSTPIEPGALGRSLATATRDFCVPYVVDGASVASLAQRPGITERHYNVHGRDVTRYRFDELPGAPEATPVGDGHCWIETQQMPVSAIPSSVEAFRTDLRLDGYTTSEVYWVPRPGILVLGGDPNRPHPHSYSTCVHGREHALIQMNGGFLVQVTSDPGTLLEASCIPAE
jgi:hypothetical protein